MKQVACNNQATADGLPLIPDSCVPTVLLEMTGNFLDERISPDFAGPEKEITVKGRHHCLLEHFGRVGLACVLFLTACESEGSHSESFGSDTVVASVGDEQVSVSELVKELRRQPTQLAPHLQDNEQLRRSILDTLLDRRLLLQEAKRLRIDDTPEYKKALRDAKERILLETAMVQMVKVDPVSEDTLRSYYGEHPEEFGGGPFYRVQEMLISTSLDTSASLDRGDEERARRIAEDLRRRVGQGEKFDGLARSHSSAASGRNGGVTDFLSARLLEEGVRKHANSLKRGEVSPVLRAQGGYYFFRLLDKREVQPRPFESVKEEILERIKAAEVSKAFKAHLRELRSKSKISVDEKVLKRITL